MKTKIKRHSRSLLSVVLSLCILVSCMTVGIIATDAAKVTGNSEAVGATADSESVGTAPAAGSTVLVKMGVYYSEAGSYYAYLYNNSTSPKTEVWVPMTKITSGYYSSDINGKGYSYFNAPSGTYEGIIIVRCGTGKEGNWKNKLNQTADCNYNGNYYQVGDSWVSGGKETLTSATRVFQIYDTVSGNSQALTDTGNGVYTYSGQVTANSTTTGFKFNDGSNWYGPSEGNYSFTTVSGTLYNISATLDIKNVYKGSNNDWTGSTFELKEATTTLTTKVMKQDFDATSAKYNDAVEDAAVGTATASPSETAQEETPLTSTLSASPTNDNYEFKGWYIDAACKTEASVTNDQITINSSTTLYALFRQKKPAQVNVSASVEGSGGSVIITSGAVSGKAYKGANVTFTATPAEGKKVYKWYVNDAVQQTAGNTLTVPNIQADTVVKVSFTDSTEILFTVASNPTGAALPVKNGDTPMSKVSGKDYYSAEKGDSIALTAGALYGNTFKKWIITYPDGTKVESTNSPYTFKPKNNFKAVAYYLSAATDTDFYINMWKDGANIANNKMQQINGSSYEGRENLAKTTVNLEANTTYYLQFNYNNSTVLRSHNDPLNWQWYQSTTTSETNANFTTTEGGTYTVLMKIYNGRTDEVEAKIIKGDIDISGTVTEEKDTTSKPFDTYKTIYAKNGSIGSDNSGTCKWGNTTLTAGGTLYKDELAFPRYKDETDYKTYYYQDDVNTYITAQTTITRGGSTGGWAVRAYVVNGETFLATKKSDGVYTAQITVPKGSGNLEVTPVYYNTKAEAANEYVKFYADATSLDNHWGNTIAFYTWYGSDDVKNDGTYPGQPMLKDGSGKYYAFVARHYINDDGSVSDKAIKGVLLDNYWENETVHKQFDPYSGKYHNLQTYDYLDPVKIASIANVDTIQFTFKYKQNENDVSTDAQSNTLRQDIANSNSHLASKYSDKHNDDTGTTNLDNDFAKDTYYEWEYLTNYDGQHVNLANQTIATEEDPLYVVSVGNQNWQKAASGQQNIGKWATVWKVYDKDGTHLMTAPPSYFIEGTDTTAYNSVISNYKNNPVLISYEHEEVVKDAKVHRDNGIENNTGIRVDGRWLYSQSTDETEALIKVVTENGASYKLCPEGGTADIGAGFKTKTEADNAGETAVGTYYGTDVWFNNRTTEAQMRLNLGNGYKFVGFKYMKNGAAAGTVLGNEFSDTIADYVDIPAEGTAANLTIDTTYRIVAVVEKLPAAAFHITHEKYGASYGNGYYYVTAQVVTSDGTVVETFARSDKGDQADMADITKHYKKGNGYSIKITLRTEPIGDNTFIRWLKNNNGSYDVVSESEKYAGSNIPVEDTLTVPFTDIFNKDGTLKIQSLNYYSDLGLAGHVSVVHYLLGDSKGTGKTTNTVTVKQNGTEVKTFAENEKVTNIGPEYIKYDENNPYTLEITLKTTPEYVSDFENFYWSNDRTKVMSEGDDDGIRTATSVKKSNMTAVVTINVNKFFKEEDGEMIFDKSLNSQTFYSSLDTALTYTIKYKYVSKQYGDQAYTVKTQPFTKEEFNKYVKSKTYTKNDQTHDHLPAEGNFEFYEFNSTTEAEFLAIKSPYEKNIRETLTWDLSDLTNKSIVIVNYYGENKQFSVEVNATQTKSSSKNFIFKFPFGVKHSDDGTVCQTDDANRVIKLSDDESPADGFSKGLSATPDYAKPYVLTKGQGANAKNVYVTAPATIYEKTGTPLYFKYWSVCTVGNDDSDSVEVTKCFSREFNYSAYQDYIITPFYDASASLSPDEQAKQYDNNVTITWAENARNQWNEGDSGNAPEAMGGQGDRIFSNFMLAYDRKDNVQLRTVTNSGIKTGVLFDRVSELDKDASGNYKTKTSKQYAVSFADEAETAKTNAKTYINNGSFDGTDKYGDGHEYMYSNIALSKLDNKNRIEFTKAFPNIKTTGENTGRKNYIYRAFGYMIESDGTVTISEPVYFTFYDIASIENGVTQSKPTVSN
ncbi:InlB B-repeat-containing protein [Ruminococcus sp. JE7B6]|uniref:InlB B-repeat-containing protein n=1 Tax=Ruminococcus sp. JE7B6 TaxID=3233380 RepID=UPI00389A75D7